jgi:carbon-monoxide dehydrogenase medium subunit
MPPHFDYHTPHSWEEAVELLQGFGPQARPLAGGTDLMILIERGQLTPAHLISLDRIPDWEALQLNGELRLGAGATYRALERRLAPDGPYAALVESARQIGGVQVRNVATVAGNLCNASPAADAVPPLLAMDAALLLCGPAGERQVGVEEFITGPGENVLGPAELLQQIRVPALPAGTATAFLKAGRRAAMEISVVCVAARLTLNEGVCEIARIALGAVAPTPLRATSAEQALQGRPLTGAAAREAARLAAEATRPISDVRASADYRRYLSEVMVRRALELCYQRITGAALP